MFLQLFYDPLYGIYVWLAGIFGINSDVIQIYHNKNIKLLSKDLVDVALKIGRYIRKNKKYNIALKVIVFGSKDRFLLIVLSNACLVISIG